MKEQDKEYSSGAEKVENIAEGQNVFEDAAVGSEMQGGAANGGAREHADAAAERAEAGRAARTLGGRFGETRLFTLPDGSVRNLIFCEKISQTPTVYPRNGGKIAKKPL